LNPKDFPKWLCRKALEQLPRTGKVRIAIDWTTEDDQRLLAISLVIRRRSDADLLARLRAISSQRADEKL